jgi:hypothetical protein
MGAWCAFRRCVAAFVLCGALVSCSTVGIGEFELYRSSFEKTYSASTAILDQLALQERLLFKRVHRPASPLIFDPALASYYTDAVDPPGTAAFRRALNTVKAYNDLLYGLASGQTAAALTTKISELESQVVSTLTAAGDLVKLGGSFKQAGVGINAAFAEVLPFIQLGLTLRAREEFRAYLDRYHPAVRALLLELRNGTKVIFPTLASAISRKGFDPTRPQTDDDRSKIEGYRKLLSDWVIMLDASIKALDEAKAAVDAPPTVVGAITAVTSTSLELEAAVTAARKHMAELATK